MTRQQLRFIQILFEGLIPIMGFFFWNWSLYFTVLFYFLDIIADFTFLLIKTARIANEQKQLSARSWSKIALGFLLLFAVIGSSHLVFYQMDPTRNFLEEINAFWSYEDLGMQQGYFLLPLVFFAAYQQYKMEFLMPARYRNMSIDQVWAPAIHAYIFQLIGVIIALIAAYVIGLEEVVYFLAIVILSSAYKLMVPRITV